MTFKYLNVGKYNPHKSFWYLSCKKNFSGCCGNCDACCLSHRSVIQPQYKCRTINILSEYIDSYNCFESKVKQEIKKELVSTLDYID